MKIYLKMFPGSPGNPNDKFCSIIDELGNEISYCDECNGRMEEFGDPSWTYYKTDLARDIVSKFNSHYELLEALKRVHELLTCPEGLISFTGKCKDLAVKIIEEDLVRKAITNATKGDEL